MKPDLFKTALVLSGGGSRALAHLGALDELLKNDIRVDLIVGTSMGAIIGGLYAHYGDLSAVSEKLREFLQSDLFVDTLSKAAESHLEEQTESPLDRFLGLFRKGIYYTHSIVRSTLVSEETYLNVMSRLIPERPIEQLDIPFAAVAMNIVDGEEVVLRTGCLRKAVSASVAIPGILPPVQTAGRFLVDGSWVDNVPAEPAISMGAHFIIGIDAASQLHELGPLPNSAMDLLHRSNDITRIRLSHERSACADVLLMPPIGHLYWADFSQAEHCVKAGHKAVSKNLGRIRRRRLLRKVLTLNGRIHPARKLACRHPFIFF